jgi:hypothetical protein
MVAPKMIMAANDCKITISIFDTGLIRWPKIMPKITPTPRVRKASHNPTMRQ